MSTRVYRTASALVLASLMLGQPVLAQETVSEPIAGDQQSQVMSSAIDQTSQTSVAVTSSFNLEQIKLGNYASLVGTWQGSLGEIIFITEQGEVLTHGANGGYMKLADVKQISPILQVQLVSYPDQVSHGSLLVLPATADSKDQIGFSNTTTRYSKINDKLTYQGIAIPQTGNIITPATEDKPAESSTVEPEQAANRATETAQTTGNQGQEIEATNNDGQTLPDQNNSTSDLDSVKSSDNRSEQATQSQATTENKQTSTKETVTDKAEQTSEQAKPSPSTTSSQILSQKIKTADTKTEEAQKAPTQKQASQTTDSSNKTAAAATDQKATQATKSAKAPVKSSQSGQAAASQASDTAAKQADAELNQEAKAITKPAATNKTTNKQKKTATLPKTGEEHGLLAWAGFFLLITSFSHWKKRD